MTAKQKLSLEDKKRELERDLILSFGYHESQIEETRKYFLTSEYGKAFEKYSDNFIGLVYSLERIRAIILSSMGGEQKKAVDPDIRRSIFHIHKLVCWTAAMLMRSDTIFLYDSCTSLMDNYWKYQRAIGKKSTDKTRTKTKK